MAICPNCQTKTDEVLAPCPTGDGYYCVDEADYAANRDDNLLGVAVGGRFVIVALLGTGSMAHVYRAYQLEVDRDVALKVFRADDLFDDTVVGKERDKALEHARKRFAQEARVLGKLGHPNCVTLFDFGTSDDGRYLYIAMEHVVGFSLRRAINRGLKLDAIYEIVHQVLQALREAHALEIVHRDLKPENIIMSFRYSSDEPVVKVVDFGIAKLLGRDEMHTTNVGALFGTPAYMSPEQARGEVAAVGPHSDIYALGCILFEMVTGRLPFESKLPFEMIRMHIEADIPPVQPRSGLDVPDELAGFITNCLQKDPDDRFQDAQAALTALARIIDEDEASVSTDRIRRLAAGKSGPIRKRVVVPTNQISGVEIDPPHVAAGETAGSGEIPLEVERERSAAGSGGSGVLDTHDEDVQPAGKPGPASAEETIGPLIIILAFIFLTVTVALLFYFMWEML